MTGVLADHEDLAMTPNDLAFVAHFLDRRTYLHIIFLSVMRTLSIYTPSRRWLSSTLFNTLQFLRKALASPSGLPSQNASVDTKTQVLHISHPAKGRNAGELACLLEAIRDAAAVQIIHGQLHRDLVTG